MKNLIFFVLTLSVTNAFAVQLVCKGQQSHMQNQRIIFVDCTSRVEVIDILEAAWGELRKQRIGGTMEDLCWKPYQKAIETPPFIPPQQIATNAFMSCNIALQHIK